MGRRSVTPRRGSSPGRPRLARAAPIAPFAYPPSFEKAAPLSQPHTLVVLMALLLLLAYVVLSSGQTESGSAEARATNFRRGTLAAMIVGAVFFSQHARDTLFSRPHPAVWRALTAVPFFYVLFLAWLLFQTVDDARQLMPLLDATLTGQPLAHRSYGDACDLTWPNLRDAVFDIFTVAHLLGWAFKAVMIRDFWISQAISVLFELMEYTFVFIQPNFNECWWDHWVLDFALCNFGGIVLGHAALWLLDSGEYSWGGGAADAAQPLWRRLLLPDITRTQWRILTDARRFLLVVVLIVGSLVVELDAFFLKDLLWLPPPSSLNVYRLIIWWLICMPGIRDFYAFTVDPTVRRIGASCWLMLAAMALEAALVVKWGALHQYAHATPPRDVVWVWATVLLLGGSLAVAWFGVLLPRIKRDAAKKVGQAAEVELSWAAVQRALQRLQVV